MKITIHEEKNSHFTFHREKKGPITSHENTLYHPHKANCFAEKAITDNRRKTIAKSVKTIAAKVLISDPDPI